MLVCRNWKRLISLSYLRKLSFLLCLCWCDNFFRHNRKDWYWLYWFFNLNFCLTLEISLLKLFSNSDFSIGFLRKNLFELQLKWHVHLLLAMKRWAFTRSIHLMWHYLKFIRIDRMSFKPFHIWLFTCRLHFINWW